MSIEDVRTAIATEIVAKLKAPPLNLTSAQIVAENNPHPSTSSSWVQHLFKPNPEPKVFTLGDGGFDIATGIYMVNLHSPLNEGPAFGLSMFNEFRKHFAAGKKLVYSGQSVTITNCGANLGRVVDAWSRSDIAIYWQAHLQRGVA